MLAGSQLENDMSLDGRPECAKSAKLELPELDMCVCKLPVQFLGSLGRPVKNLPQIVCLPEAKLPQILALSIVHDDKFEPNGASLGRGERHDLLVLGLSSWWKHGCKDRIA